MVRKSPAGPIVEDVTADSPYRALAAYAASYGGGGMRLVPGKHGIDGWTVMVRHWDGQDVTILSGYVSWV